MNIIKKAIEDVYFDIPRKILEDAFLNTRKGWLSAPTSLDSLISDKVVHKKVLKDLDIVSGETMYIPLNGVSYESPDPCTRIYDIPLSMSGNRRIYSPIGLRLGHANGGIRNGGGTTGLLTGCPDSEVSQSLAQLHNSMIKLPKVSTAQVDLVGPNMVLVRDSARTSGNLVLHCEVSNDSQLNNLKPRSSLVISELVMHAVKAYIYNKLYLKIGEGHLMGGQHLDAYKDIISSYSDSSANYKDHLAKIVTKTLFMNDNIAHERFIQGQVNIFHL